MDSRTIIAVASILIPVLFSLEEVFRVSIRGKQALPLWTVCLALPPGFAAMFYNYQANSIAFQRETLANFEPFQMACIGIALALALPPIAARGFDRFLGRSKSNHQIKGTR